LVKGEDFPNFAIEEGRTGLSRSSMSDCKGSGVTKFAAILTSSSGSRGLGRVWLKDDDIGTESSQEMTTVPEGISKRFPEAEVTEPAVTNNEEVLIVERGCYLVDHVNGLLNFGLELHNGSTDFDWAGFKIFLEVVEARSQRKEDPAFFDDFENTDADDIL